MFILFSFHIFVVFIAVFISEYSKYTSECMFLPINHYKPCNAIPTGMVNEYSK